MQSFMLTSWTTMSGQSTVTSITQGASGWLDLTGFQDVVAWLDVREVNLGGGTSVTLTYQTSPTRDEVLFAGLTSAVTLSATTFVTKMLKDTTSVPLARWLRWQLAVTGSPTASWDATFRIWIAANAGARSRGRGAAAATVPSKGGCGCQPPARWMPGR